MYDNRVPNLALSCTGIDANGNSAGPVVCTTTVTNTGPSQDTLSYSGSVRKSSSQVVGANTTYTGTPLNRTYTYTDNGTYSITAVVTDEATNQSTTRNVSFKIDTTAPTVTSTFDWSKWYNAQALSG